MSDTARRLAEEARSLADEWDAEQAPGPWGKMRELADALEAAEARLAQTQEITVVHHHDIEKRAEHFNEGWDEAHRQGVGGTESREWLFSKVEPILREWIDTAYRLATSDKPPADGDPVKQMRHLHLAQPEIPTGLIADAVLSESDLSEARLAEVTAERDELAALVDQMRAALTQADSIMSLVLYRNGSAQTAQDRIDLDGAITIARSITSHQSPADAPAQHDRAVTAKALRDAVDAYERESDGTIQWLRARAEELDS